MLRLACDARSTLQAQIGNKKGATFAAALMLRRGALDFAHLQGLSPRVDLLQLPPGPLGGFLHFALRPLLGRTLHNQRAGNFAADAFKLTLELRADALQLPLNAGYFFF